MKLRYEDWRLESHSAHSRAIFQIPEHCLPILRRREDVAIIGRPAEGLYLRRVSSELARNAICLYVEYGYGAIQTARREEVTAVTEADACAVAAA